MENLQNPELEIEIPRCDSDIQYSCGNDSLEQCFIYLSQELANLGYPVTFRRPMPNGKENRTSVLINTMQHVTVFLSEAKKSCEALEERNQRLSSDLNHAYSTENRLKATLEQSEKQILIMKEKERQILVKLKSSQCDLKAEKDEARRLKSVLQQKEAQYLHEIRRKERELTQLSDQLYRALGDKKQEVRPGMQILNVLPRSDGTRGRWNTGTIAKKQESDFLKTVMHGYETRNAELVEENVALKDTLSSMLREMEAFAVECHSPENVTTDAESIADRNDARPSTIQSKDSGIGIFNASSYCNLHFKDTIHQNVVAFFRDKWKLVKDNISYKLGHLPIHKPCSHEDKQEVYRKEIDTLKEELTKMHKLNEEQEKLLDAVVRVDNTDNPYLKDGFILEEKERFQKERDIFLEHRGNFERERKAFTEAALRLARDKRDFEDQRNNISKLYGIETPPNRRRSAKAEYLSNRRSLPSTPELYQVLGLTNAD